MPILNMRHSCQLRIKKVERIQGIVTISCNSILIVTVNVKLGGLVVKIFYHVHHVRDGSIFVQLFRVNAT